MRSIRLSSLALVFTLSLGALAQQTAQPTSYVVRPDRTVRFTYQAPGASKVTLELETFGSLPMAKDQNGLWSVATQPLPPEIYGYHFTVDGAALLDPSNSDTRRNLLYPANDILIPGDTPMPWEVQSIPHGAVTHHIYTTSILKGLLQDQEDYFVYTPPGYDPRAKKLYPVLYLFHGFSDTSVAWTEVGKANLILDSLIASGKARPMIVVMPSGYGAMDFISRPANTPAWHEDMIISSNMYGRALLQEIIPQVEFDYRASKSRDDRAIAGLSMGGLESLSIGLRNPDLFAWIGSFSGVTSDVPSGIIANADAQKAKLRLLWIACGTEDAFIAQNRTFVATLKAKDFPVTVIETPGIHAWPVWRDNLLHFAPLLFQK